MGPAGPATALPCSALPKARVGGPGGGPKAAAVGIPRTHVPSLGRTAVPWPGCNALDTVRPRPPRATRVCGKGHVARHTWTVNTCKEVSLKTLSLE